MGISFGGVASGLDTSAIISALVGLERRPILNLQRVQANEQARLDLVGTLEGLVKSLRDKAEELTTDSSFFSNKLDVGTEGVANFTVSGTALEGSHTLDVQSLAAADLWSFDAQADSDTTNLLTDEGLDGAVSFDYDGVSYNVVIDSSLSSGAGTLQTIADSINNESAAGEKVIASVVNVGTDNTPSYELLLTGRDTGSDFAITNIGVSNLEILDATGAAENERAASNAVAVVDGLTVSRSTNLFDDVIEGVSFTVTRADATNGTAQTTFGISTDVEGIKKNVQSFLDEYNKVIDFIDKQEAYSEEGGAGGDLFGDSILRSVRNALQEGVLRPDGDVLDNTDDGFNSLGLIGIDLDSDGRLTLNDTEFDEKLSESLSDLADFFLEDNPVDDVSDQGILLKITESIDALVESTQARGEDPDGTGPLEGDLILDENGNPITVQGVFARRKSTLQTLIDRIDDDIERKERSVEAFEANLVQRYANLESLIGRLNSQQSYLQASGI